MLRLLIIVLLMSNPAKGWGADEGYEINKCVGKGGDVIYSQGPCPKGKKQKLIVSVSTEHRRAVAEQKKIYEERERIERIVQARERAKLNAKMEAYIKAMPRVHMDSEDDFEQPSRSRYSENTSSSGSLSMPAPPPQPSVITSCDTGGCWDNMGGRYNKGAGTTYFPSTGGACQMIGGMMQCP